jgi:hypothetical protein
MNRRERRRARSLKQFIASGDADRQGSPEFEAEVERDEKLALELEQHIRIAALLPWLARHPEVDWTCTAPALLRIAALEIMAACPPTTPDDFGVMVCEVAKSVVPAAREVSKKAREFLRTETTARSPASETIVQKQVRFVLEQQTREIAEKVKAWCPAGVGFLLFLADYGEKGNLAYVSTCDRVDAIKLVVDWLARQRAEGPSQ